jgi:hypothetical protein
LPPPYPPAVLQRASEDSRCGPRYRDRRGAYPPAGPRPGGRLGANGIIGTNRPDGAETAAAVLADLAGRAVPARPDVIDLLAARNRLPSDWAGWLRLEEYEGALGAAAGRGRVKVHDLESMLRCCATTMRQ